MDIFVIIYLLIVGFLIGLSGALIPGPLLAFTIKESLKKGKHTGIFVIIGHMIVEIIIISLILVGLMSYMSSHLFISIVSVTGGIVLILTALALLREYKNPSKVIDKQYTYSSTIGGIVFTIFNPSFPIWWATAGNRLLLEGLKIAGFFGMLLLVIGHWIADFSWYYFVSFSVAHGRKKIVDDSVYKSIILILVGFLFLFGIYFLISGI